MNIGRESAEQYLDRVRKKYAAGGGTTRSPGIPSVGAVAYPGAEERTERMPRQRTARSHHPARSVR